MYISFKNKTCRYNVYLPYIVGEVPRINVMLIISGIN